MKHILLISLICLFISCAKNTPDGQSSDSTYKDSLFTSLFQRTTGWVAGDGGNSIPLGNGKSLWLWGDSHIGHYDAATNTVPCLFQVRNAGLLMGMANPTEQTTYTSNASPASWFQYGNDNKYWFWPGAGYQYKDTAYIFLGRLRATGVGGGFGFEGVDTSYVAKIKIPEMTIAGYSILANKKGIGFNNAVIKDGDYNYVYGIKGNGLGNDVFVARFPVSDVYAPWEYYGNKGWSADISSIKKIHAEFTSSFNLCKIKNKYVMITTEFSVGCDQGKHIYSYTSDKPYGPFGNKQTIWTLDDTLQGHYPFFYLASTHPEYDNGKNELLITYCINGYGSCVETCVNNRKDPDSYRPKAIRVPYKLIDSEL